MLVQVELFGEDCHWYVIPQPEVAPDSDSEVVDVPQVRVVGLAVAVPAVGVPEQDGAQLNEAAHPASTTEPSELHAKVIEVPDEVKLPGELVPA